MDIDPALLWGLFALVFVGIGLMTVYMFFNADALLQAWAAKNGYRIVDAALCYFRKGPYTWVAGKGHFVYYVTVATADGARRKGWVFGSCWGRSPNGLDVTWDDKA